MNIVTFGRAIGLALEKPIMLVFRRHADYALPITIEATVTDRNGHALPGVRVMFIDTSFDEIRRKTPDKHSIGIGESDATGKVHIRFRYFWSRNVVWLCLPRVGPEFRLMFKADGFEDHVITVRTSEHAFQEGALQVRIEQTIRLQESVLKQ